MPDVGIQQRGVHSADARFGVNVAPPAELPGVRQNGNLRHRNQTIFSMLPMVRPASASRTARDPRDGLRTRYFATLSGLAARTMARWSPPLGQLSQVRNLGGECGVFCFVTSKARSASTALPSAATSAVASTRACDARARLHVAARRGEGATGSIRWRFRHHRARRLGF